MLQIPTWSKILTVLILIAGILFALPNALSKSMIAHLPGFMPKEQVTLGLDLQGGSYLLLQVELDKVIQDRLNTLVADIRMELRKSDIGYRNLESKGNSASVEIINPTKLAEARRILDRLNPAASGGLLSVGAHQYAITASHSVISMTLTDSYITQLRSQIVSQSIEVVRRRIDAMGTREPTIEQQDTDRILVQVPGLQDPSRMKAILGKTAKMTFQLVDESASIPEAVKGIVPIGDELLYESNPVKGGPPIPIVVQRRIMVSGDRLVDASAGIDQQTGQPEVDFRFDTVGARQFANVTKNNVGQRFAIVLDNKVISAPVIQEPILGGSGRIDGNFTVQSANDLALLLRAGALPAPLKILEERTVGAELGADSVRAGKYSAIGGLILVVIFMVLRYGLFGVFADVALTLNVVLLFAILTMMGATLTLPGIAGIVLTMGMAVDANVLIYERIREEIRNGRTIVASIDTGFRRAMATIVDANMTHVIASAILFQLGSGPIRGFAVTLLIGIITSFFTAVMVTRLIVVSWFQAVRPKRLAI
ncbi:MAG: protein translocase subunit SecD [Alphaproteobacteria bacterium]|nr:protein translocase subunit SecD [Alphaproteobacteria bacterium]